MEKIERAQNCSNWGLKTRDWRELGSRDPLDPYLGALW